jgi:flagellar hook-associated protein 1 FlgK
MSSILSIGQSALSAAQAGLATTGHNIANASTPGYSRQSIVQSSVTGQNLGQGFLGAGTQVVDITRAFDSLVTSQLQATKSSQSSTSTYLSQLSNIDNLIGDNASGVSPAMQDFFKGIQDVSAAPQSAASRQSLLSDGQALSARFQTLNGQLVDANNSVNTQITASAAKINSYAKQISSLNDTIAKATAGGSTPNDLLDQRDKMVSDLSVEIKVNVVNDGKSGYNVFIGNGQPLVVGTKTYDLVAQTSPTDPSKIEVAYQGPAKNTILSESSLSGGTLGGLFDFRANSLDVAKNSLGRIAIVLADSINAQHKLGVDQTGAAGGDFFNEAVPTVSANINNTGTGVASASITSAQALTISDYKLQYDGSKYTVTRLSDGQSSTLSSIPQTVDGVQFGIASGSPAAGDSYLIKPTVNGAADFNVKISDVKQIALASPVTTAIPVTNTGTGKITSGVINSSYLGSPLASPVSLSFTAGATPGTGTLSGFPSGTTVAYTAGSPISFGGITFTINGAPANGDVFKISPNTSGTGDNRNAVLMGSVQTAQTVSGSTTLQTAYASMVSLIGNKTRELGVIKSSEDKILSAAIASQQSVSGVNLDEEAANLLKYQQAYQAAGKLMQTASTLFDVLLSLH